MVLQMGDCIDCLKVYGTSYDFLFLFDHSNGDGKLQPNGLNANKIYIKFGGQQPRMRDTLLNNNIKLGQCNLSRHLHHGDIQSMVFRSDDPGPFYLSDRERERERKNMTNILAKSMRKTKEG